MPNLPASAPLLMVPTGTLRALHQTLGDRFGPREAAEALRAVGGECGEPLFRTLEQLIEQNAGVTDAAALGEDQFWNSLQDLFDNLGWGELRFERLHPGVGALTSADWIEAEQAGSAAQPSCHLTTGLLAELLQRLVPDAELAVLEVDCRARGDAACRFLFGGADTLQSVHASMLEGAPYEQAVAMLEERGKRRE